MPLIERDSVYALARGFSWGVGERVPVFNALMRRIPEASQPIVARMTCIGAP